MSKTKWVNDDLIVKPLKYRITELEEQVERLENGLQSTYDSDADVFYISFGKPMPSVSREVECDFLIRRDIESNKITGVTILNYSKLVIQKQIVLDNREKE